MERVSYLQSYENEHPSDLALIFNPLKNLNGIFDSIQDDILNSYLNVYLRVRPSLPEEVNDVKDTSVDISDENSVSVTAPTSSNTFRNAVHGISKLSQKFTFTHIYGPETGQKALFDNTTLCLIKDFLQGQNSLLFAYGTTKSGKTYTVQGSQDEPGIIPRAVDIIFNAVGNHLYPYNDLRPRYFCGVERLDESQIIKAEETKEAVLKGAVYQRSHSEMSLAGNLSGACSVESLLSTIDIVSVLEDEVDDAGLANLEKESNGNFSFAINGKRPTLNLGEDRNGSVYIKGLNEIRVNTKEEILRLLEIGKRNLTFAATKLNQNSSRSHCIFTVKMMRFASFENPHVARVATFSVCDLAGAERVYKAQGNSERIKETGNINTSLLVLGRCIFAVRQNQMLKNQTNKKREVQVPYRESKLTSLFKSFFLGRGRVSMIVNITNSSNLFDETLHVLKFSALARQVELCPVKEPEKLVKLPQRKSQFAMLKRSLNSSGRLSVPWENSSNVSFGQCSEISTTCNMIEEEDEEPDEKYEAYLDLIRQLKDHLKQALFEKNEIESCVRKRLCTEFSEQLVHIEDTWRLRMRDQLAKAEENTEWRINLLVESLKEKESRKRQRLDDSDEEYVPSSDLIEEQLKVEEREKQISILEIQLKQSENEVETLRLSVKKTAEKNSKLQEEITKLTFQLALLTQSLDEKSKDVDDTKQLVSSTKLENEMISEFQQKLVKYQEQLHAKDQKVKELSDMLMEAAEEYCLKQKENEELEKKIINVEDNSVKQLMRLHELESELEGAQALSSEQSLQLEEKEKCIAELADKLNNKSLTQIDKLKRKLREDFELEKRKLEESHLREKSKLLVELSSLRYAAGSDFGQKIKKLLFEIDALKAQEECITNEKADAVSKVEELEEKFNHLKLANADLETLKEEHTKQLVGTELENERLLLQIKEYLLDREKLIKVEEENYELHRELEKDNDTLRDYCELKNYFEKIYDGSIEFGTNLKKHVEKIVNEHKELLEKILVERDKNNEWAKTNSNQLEKIKELEKNLSDLSTALKEREDSAVQSEILIKTLTKEKEVLCNDLQEVTHDFVRIKDKGEELMKEKDELEQDIENQRLVIMKKADELFLLSEEHDALQENLKNWEDKFQNKIQELQNEIDLTAKEKDNFEFELLNLKKEAADSDDLRIQLQHKITELIEIQDKYSKLQKHVFELETNENILLADQKSSKNIATSLQTELNDVLKDIKEKNFVIQSLSNKLSALDKKLNLLEDEYETLKRNKDEIEKEFRNRVEILTKENAALKVARQEDTSILKTKDDELCRKEEEIQSLQIEVKTYLQQSQVSNITSLSAKAEDEVNALQYNLRQSEEANLHLQEEISELRLQWGNHLQDKKFGCDISETASPVKTRSKGAIQKTCRNCTVTTGSDSVNSTPEKLVHNTRSRRRATNALRTKTLDTENLHDDYQPSLQSSHQKASVSDEDDCVFQKPGRKPTSRKLRSKKKISNPHLENPENINVLNNQEIRVPPNTKKGRKHRLFSTIPSEDLFDCPPSAAPLDNNEDVPSPHTTVRHQLRSRVK